MADSGRRPLAPQFKLPSVEMLRERVRESSEVRDEYLDHFVEIAGPHCRQVSANAVRRLLSMDSIIMNPIADIPLFLPDDAPMTPFVDRPESERSTLHWGQMKLFASELWFLTEHVTMHVPATVLYAGAAPGNHIMRLAHLFPKIHFVLYDPSPFCPEINHAQLTNVEIHNEFFTETVAKSCAQRYWGAVYFICDIRTGKTSEYIKADMDRQKKWHEMIHPMASLLKFRLPWASNRGQKTVYLGGSILLGTFQPPTSTESRLVVPHGAVDREYDNSRYEAQCAHHNMVGRVKAYYHEVNVKGLDLCHDCAALVTIVSKYLAHAGLGTSSRDVAAFIDETCISFGSGRTIADSCEKQRLFPKFDFTDDILRMAGTAAK
jgi:hypothetical protein